MTLPTRLSHVYWIGGATDAGKTSLARALAERLGFRTFHYDDFDHEAPDGHWARRDLVQHPAMSATRIDDPDWMWVDTTPERLAEDWLRTTPEQFSMVVADLLALPSTPPIIAEGYGFLPALVQPLLLSRRQAIWLVSTDAFKRATYARRGKGTFTGVSDPARARENHIGRDLLLAAIHQRQAEELGLASIVIDGTMQLNDVVEIVAAHFAATGGKST